MLYSDALPVDPVDRINEIEDDIDDLDAIEQFPGEAKFYRTSTEIYDDFVLPQIEDVSDDGTNENDSNATNETIVAQGIDHKIPLIPQEAVHEMETTKPPTMNGIQFLELANFLIGQNGLPEANGNGANGNDDANDDVELKTELPISDGSTVSDIIEDGTIEVYTPRTLKQPIISQTVKDVLHAFKLLHNWRFTK